MKRSYDALLHERPLVSSPQNSAPLDAPTSHVTASLPSGPSDEELALADEELREAEYDEDLELAIRLSLEQEKREVDFILSSSPSFETSLRPSAKFLFLP